MMHAPALINPGALKTSECLLACVFIVYLGPIETLFAQKYSTCMF